MTAWMQRLVGTVRTCTSLPSKEYVAEGWLRKTRLAQLVQKDACLLFNRVQSFCEHSFIGSSDSVSSVDSMGIVTQAQGSFEVFAD